MFKGKEYSGAMPHEHPPGSGLRYKPAVELTSPPDLKRAF